MAQNKIRNTVFRNKQFNSNSVNMIAALIYSSTCSIDESFATKGLVYIMKEICTRFPKSKF